MGGDGGVIATKRAYVRGAKLADADEQKSLKQHQIWRSRFCAQSSEMLREPIVCCELGNLYNKEALLTALIDKNLSTNLAHVRGLKDVKTLILCQNPNYSADNEVEGEQPPMFSCPITKMEFNTNQPFVAIWTTGYVLSEKAVKEVGIEALQSEYGPFAEDDVVRLIPTVFELEAQVARMVARRNRKKAEKGSKEGKEGSKKRKLEGKAAEVKSSAPAVAGVKSFATNNLVKNAITAVKGQEDQSSVYKNLFHKDKAKDTRDGELFMAVGGAGFRYTIN
ncbi:Rtf2 RING-finger-domain-containing protein [Ochromonadaceae sp. CCMP2298]|nr:Rtf2 RING-finger-domain-containing protein [Ochromonadaceae sp. CCMP2298]